MSQRSHAGVNRSAAGPFAASFFIPGLGSLINGATLNGIALFVLWIFGIVDAYLGTARWNRRHGRFG